MRKFSMMQVCIGFALALSVSASYADSAANSAPNSVEEGVSPGEPRKGWAFKEAGMIPILSGGRLKPLDTFAREVMLHQTGSRFFQGWKPVDLLFSMMTAPQVWETREFITVGRDDVRRQIGLDEKRTRFSPKELFAESFLVQYAREMGGKPTTVGIVGQAVKSDPRQDELTQTLERLSLFRRIVSGEAWPTVPSTGSQPWKTLAETDPAGQGIRESYARMAIAYRDGNRAAFEGAAAEARSRVLAAIEKPSPGLETDLKIEYFYNTYHPFMVSWIAYLVGALLWTVAILLSKGSRAGHPAWSKAAMGVTLVGVLAHVVGFGMRCWIAGRPPVTNMYESIIWVSFGAVAFSFIIYFMQKQAVLLAVACALGALGMIAADAAPAMMDPGIHPLVPVLRSNYWLTIHVLTITLGYSAFALTMGLGNVALFQYLRNPKDLATRAANMNQLAYRAMQIGVVLLAAGTILGGVWADYSWGRFWGWDPKEVWALIALLNYLVILHARFTGWVGQFGFALWNVVAFMGVVMAWYGVNFVLGVGLHSYGFSTGGRGAVGVFCVIQLAYCAAVALIVRMRKKGRGGGRPSAPAPGVTGAEAGA